MNYVKPSVTGIDIPIQKLQSLLYDQIKTIWSVTDSTFNMYGRAYRNQLLDGSYIPEVYVGNKEYKDSYFDDAKSGSAFFTYESTKVNGVDTIAVVSLIMMVNLAKIKPGTTRNDEEARVDIERMVSNGVYGFFLTGIVTGIDQVFKEYGTKSIKYRDMQPWHCFRLNFNITYNIYDCN
jgi:hypothetical protein